MLSPWFSSLFLRSTDHPNRTYTKNYPALAPLASGEEDNPAVEINVGMEIRDEHIVAASRQHSAREHLRGFDLATLLEVTARKKRLAGLINESVSTLPIGQDWADMLAREMRQAFANVQADKLANRTLLLTATDLIVPVPNRDGVLPNDALLRFYNLPFVGNLPDKKAALLSHLGPEQTAHAFRNN